MHYIFDVCAVKAKYYEREKNTHKIESKHYFYSFSCLSSVHQNKSLLIFDITLNSDFVPPLQSPLFLTISNTLF